MALTLFNEDTLVQQTTAEYMRDELGQDLFYAYNFDPDGQERSGQLDIQDLCRVRDHG